MARSGLDTGSYDFPEPPLPSKMGKSQSFTQLGQAGKIPPRSKSAQCFFARSVSPEKSRSFVQTQKRSLPKMVPESLRKDLHRYGMAEDGPMGLKNSNAVSRYFEFKGYVDGGEYRSLTVAQFMQIYAYVEAKCIDWGLAQAEVNFHHVDTWLTQPATKNTNSSLFEHIGDRQQAPTWFLSHWWGEPFINVQKCLRRHAKERGLPTHCAYWICAFANRQSELAADDVMNSNFARAMNLAKFKLLLVLNVSSPTSPPATPFKRLWCLLECSMCLEQVSSPIDTAVVVPGTKEADVEMVCSGMTKFEKTSDKYLAGRGMAAKAGRETTFPDEIVHASLGLNIKLATTSDARDRARILNCIIGQPLDAQPPREHPKFDELNKRLQGLFAQIYYHRALARDRPTKEDARKKFMQHLGHLSTAIANDSHRKSLSLCLAGCRLDEDESIKLVAQGVPTSALHLSLNLQHSGINVEQLRVLAGALPKELQVLSLDLSGCYSICDRDVMKFVGKLNKNLKTLVLGLQRTQVGSFLLEVLKTENLQDLRERAELQGDGIEMIKDPRSKDQQSEQRQALLENMIRTKHSHDVRARLLHDLAAAGQPADRLEMNRRREFPV